MASSQENYDSVAVISRNTDLEKFQLKKNINFWQSSSGGVRLSILLSLLMFLVPAVGSFSDYLVQDTLKSALVLFGVLVLGLLFFMESRDSEFEFMRWHILLLAPGLLLVYSVGCMAWSPAHYAAASAVRWLIFALLMWLVFCIFSKDRIDALALGIHVGAFAASFWAVLQFWFDIQFISQGPPPASTFFNRNFFSEYVVCTLPFSVFLLMRGGGDFKLRLISFSLGINGLALMMTGTRSAQIALFAMLVVGGGLFIFWAKKELKKQQINFGKYAPIFALIFIPVFLFGSIPTGNQKIIQENSGVAVTPLSKSFQRSASMLDAKEYTEKSFSVRSKMWHDTFKMIRANPFFGVGAGAWNVYVPIYQDDAESIETDYYAHNEFIQLVSEYGVAGWLFLIALGFYWIRSFWFTMRLVKNLPTDDDASEILIRSTALISLLMMAVVSCAGFPWHMAATAALFAICLGVLMASDFRMDFGGVNDVRFVGWNSFRSHVSIGVFSLALLVSGFLTVQSLSAERKIIKAVNLSLTITAYGDVGSAKWNDLKQEIIQSVKDSVAINSNDRFMIPRVADEFAKWGDWGNAIWIWKTVLDSHPYLFGVMTNIARGYLVMGDLPSSNLYLDRVRKLRPNDPNLRVLDVVMLTKTQGTEQAKKKVNELLVSGVHDFEFLKIVYWLGSESKDFNMILKSLELMVNFYPENLVDASLEIGKIHTENIGFIDEEAAVVAYRRALAAAPTARKADVLKQIPLRLQSKL